MNLLSNGNAADEWPTPGVLPIDPLAEKRFAFGQAAFEDGAYAEAAEILEQALVLAPEWVAAWMALGAAEAGRGAIPRARTAFQRALALDPTDRHGAILSMARLSDATTARPKLPSRAPSAYVAALFDGYAARFDTHLSDGLGYRGPADLVAALQAAGFLRFARALDLGCGTGLCGTAIRPFVDHLAGIDLSPAMIDKARAKGQYDGLAVADLQTFLQDQPSASLDLVLAGDVFIYIGDIGALFVDIARVLRAGGAFAFTMQEGTGPADFALGDDLRFVHSLAYASAQLEDAKLEIVTRDHRSIRREKGVDVPGLLMIARKAA